jgi:hypothetical protein
VLQGRTSFRPVPSAGAIPITWAQHPYGELGHREWRYCNERTPPARRRTARLFLARPTPAEGRFLALNRHDGMPGQSPLCDYSRRRQAVARTLQSYCRSLKSWANIILQGDGACLGLSRLVPRVHRLPSRRANALEGWGAQISGAPFFRTGSPGSCAKSSVFLKREAHLCELAHSTSLSVGSSRWHIQPFAGRSDSSLERSQRNEYSVQDTSESDPARDPRRVRKVAYLTATASAARSFVSRAIFCANMTSPGTRSPSGMKHHAQTD